MSDEESAAQEASPAPGAAGPTVSGLSGNEIYCLAEAGYTPGEIAVGNSVHALGFLRSIGSGIRGFVGGEITQFTELLADGRQSSIGRLEEETKGSAGVTGVTTEIIARGDQLEFVSIGSRVHAAESAEAFSSSTDGQELFAQIDAGYRPLKFVFGNVAYSIGAGRGITGAFRTLVRGEVPQYTNIFSKTRQLALERIVAEAKAAGANAVTNIRAEIVPIAGAGYGMQEMILSGTASRNEALSDTANQEPVTSDLINQELWSMTKKGYAPVKMVLGTSVYVLGFVGGLGAFFKSFTRGEIPQLTKLVYEAREKSIEKIREEAKAIGADEVVGTKLYLYSLGGNLIEVLAIGTAVKKNPDVATRSPQLMAQAIIQDKDTFVDRSVGMSGSLSGQSMRAGRGIGIVSVIGWIILIIVYVLLLSAGGSGG